MTGLPSADSCLFADSKTPVLGGAGRSVQDRATEGKMTPDPSVGLSFSVPLVAPGGRSGFAQPIRLMTPASVAKPPVNVQRE